MQSAGSYVKEILKLRTDGERSDAINRVPPHLRAMVRKMVLQEVVKRECADVH